MASEIGLIREHVRATIEALTEVASCADCLVDAKRTVMPFAEIAWQTARPDPDGDLNTALTWIVPFVVLVTGSSLDQVDDAMEAIEILWSYNATNLAALRLLGGEYIYPQSKNLPVRKEGSNQIEGVLTMELAQLRRP